MPRPTREALAKAIFIDDYASGVAEGNSWETIPSVLRQEYYEEADFYLACLRPDEWPDFLQDLPEETR